ncbi:MAG: transketolase C-terminal domain-containing protein [Acidimicrobiia bacterium]|nr:transketolase C-terminal domain-containing protein [Acidimicrobiia bacterium]
MTTLAPGKALRVAFGETITELAATNDRIVVLDGDTGSSTRTDIFEKAYPDRFFQMGITEMNMLGMAAGMATLGLIPIVSTFSCFIVSRAHDSIRVLIAQPNANVKMMGGYAGLLAGMTGKTHLMFDDVSIMRAMAHMTVVAPVDEVETRTALEAIIEYEGPVYFRLTRPNTPILMDEDYKFELGKLVTVREGSDLTLFATGTQTARAFEASEKLAADGIDVHLVHVPTIKPLDVDAVVAAAEKTGLVMTSEEHTIVGGLGGAIAEALAENSPLPMKRHGLQDVFGESGPNDALLDKYGISAPHVESAVKGFLAAHR